MSGLKCSILSMEISSPLSLRSTVPLSLRDPPYVNTIPATEWPAWPIWETKVNEPDNNEKTTTLVDPMIPSDEKTP